MPHNGGLETKSLSLLKP
uniref:Uncharacterized protein n=1 Tax=Anguilla anguilla TaxID=7936 RepID=A0A0E9W2C2_ANGAN